MTRAASAAIARSTATILPPRTPISRPLRPSGSIALRTMRSNIGPAYNARPAMGTCLSPISTVIASMPKTDARRAAEDHDRLHAHRPMEYVTLRQIGDAARAVSGRESIERLTLERDRAARRNEPDQCAH